MGADHWAAMMAILEQADGAATDARNPVRMTRDRHYGSRVAAGLDTTPTVEDIDLTSVRWQDQANCKGADTDDYDFFPVRVPTNKVLRLCAACPVLDQCRQYALDRPFVVGIWAGTTDAERRRLRAAVDA